MLVSNISHSHRDVLNSLLSGKAEKLVIVSPFLASDIQNFLREFRLEGLESVELITTFKPENIEQYTKPFQIKEFFDFFKENYPGIKTTVHVDNHLHGKLYIVSYKTEKKMIITSANFTQNGMVVNNEWGMLTDDSDIISKALEEVYDNLEYREITYNQIIKACLIAERSPGFSDVQKQHQVNSDILKRVYSDIDESNVDPKYFLKPCGSVDDPITLASKADCSALHQNLYFSQKMPKGVRKGDYVITTAIGAGSLLSYFRVTGGLQQIPVEQQRTNPECARWPWYMEGRNQSQDFGRQWWKHNLRRQDMLNEFLDLYPGIPVTHAGGFNLKTINMGNDKVRITKKFGDFLIKKIRECENTPAFEQEDASKYSGLTDFLNRQTGAEVRLFFHEFTEKTGIILPDSAIKHRAYWGNQSNVERRPWAKAWQKAGFYVGDVDQSDDRGWVRFKKKHHS